MPVPQKHLMRAERSEPATRTMASAAHMSGSSQARTVEKPTVYQLGEAGLSRRFEKKPVRAYLAGQRRKSFGNESAQR